MSYRATARVDSPYRKRAPHLPLEVAFHSLHRRNNVVQISNFRREVIYSPFGSQKRFHKIQARFKGFSGPVGSGKSRALCQEALRLAYLNAGCVGLVGSPTYRMLSDVTRLTFLEILSQNQIPHRFSKSDNSIDLIECRSTVRFRSLDEPYRLVGPNLAWFAVDEASYCEEDSWRRLEARLRDPKAKLLAGAGAWTPNGLNWTYQRFIGAEKVEGYEAVEAEPFENMAILGKTPDFYDRLKRSYDEQFYEQEVLGKYLNLVSGSVYYAFRDDANVKHCEYDRRYPVCWTLDFNVAPLCSLICQIIPIDPRLGEFRLRVLDEIVLQNGATPQACDEFARRTERWTDAQFVEVSLYGDPSGNSRQTSAEHTDWQIIRSFFERHPEYVPKFHVLKAHPLVRDRTNTVNSMLRNAAGEVRLEIDPHCKNLLADLRQLRWATDSYGNVTEGLDKRDPKRSHTSDSLGYLTFVEFGVRRSGGPVGQYLF